MPPKTRKQKSAKQNAAGKSDGKSESALFKYLTNYRLKGNNTKQKKGYDEGDRAAIATAIVNNTVNRSGKQKAQKEYGKKGKTVDTSDYGFN